MFFPDRLAAETPPAVPAVGTPGFFTHGNAGLDVPATPVESWWLNMVTQELAAVVAAAGLTRDKTNNAQVVQAINALITAGVPSLANVAFLNQVQSFSKAQGSTAKVLTAASPVAIDFADSNLFTFAPATSFTLGNPGSVVNGRPFMIIVTQPVGGNCAWGFNANWVFEDNELPSPLLTANALNIFIGTGLPASKATGRMISIV
ncbi:hypothetical protein [Ferrovibrio terrae]|uniref:hypothetical protein n=1 Tax=Ferrovibrio terrae TaxID=2594003 RepID=UPI0031383301